MICLAGGCDLPGTGYDLLRKSKVLLSEGDGLLGRDTRQWYELLSTSSDLLGESFWQGPRLARQGLRCPTQGL